MNRKLNNKGFTLIEVVLVLAIGGLIFLLAFLAFQQVSTNRRDTQRRSDAARMVAELQNYKGDIGSFPVVGVGFTPGTFENVFMEKYMGADFKDPQQHKYYNSGDLSTAPIDATVFGLGFIWPFTYGPNKKCNGSEFDSAAQPNSVAIIMKLEKGTVCRDAQ